MRKAFRVILVFLCLVSLTLPAFAASSAQSVSVYSTVGTDGSCLVTVNMTLNLENKLSELLFPLPAGASDVSVNGSSARTFSRSGVTVISLDKSLSGMVGSVSVSIHYRLSNVLQVDENETVTAQIDLLSGFSLPVETMEFTVTFPGDIAFRPNFFDTYLQDSMESNLTYTTQGATLTGQVLEPLKDHDTVRIFLEVPAEQFPESPYLRHISHWTQIAMMVCAGLALLYWLLFLRCLPVLPQRQTTVPEAITAGEVGTVLAGQGAFLPLMAVSWAQMGYLLICADRKGNILLKKRMDMGNERSAHENRIFAALFRKGNTVDTSKRPFALLSARVLRSRDAARRHFRPGTGRREIYGFLFLAVAFFGGLSLASLWFLTGFARILGSVVLSLFGLFSGYLIQRGMASLLLHSTDRKVLALLSVAAWVLLGALSGQMVLCLVIAGSQIFAGLTGPYSGRRNATGRQAAAELLGLRLHIVRMHRKDSVSPDNPDYFYQLLPFALALGVDGPFARCFSDRNLPDCTFLQVGRTGHQNAVQFASTLRQTVSAMDERRKTLASERIFGR